MQRRLPTATSASPGSEIDTTSREDMDSYREETSAWESAHLD